MTARKMWGHWYVDFYDEERRRVRRRSPVDSRRGAQIYEAQLRVQGVEDGSSAADESGGGERLDDERRRRPATFGAWLDEWVEVYPAANNNKDSERAMKRGIIRNHLKPALGKLPLEELGSARGTRYVDRFKERQVTSGLTPKTVNNQLAVLRRALVTAKEWGYIDSLPTIRWFKLEEPEFDFLEEEESDRLVAASGEQVVMVETALNTGMRIGELLALRWESVDLVARMIRVRRAVWKGREGSPKSGRPRDIPINDRLLARLRAHRHLRGPYVFCHDDGRPLTRDSIKRTLPEACRRAGLRPVQWHALRHTFASQLVRARVPLKAIQELLGHADIRMTMRYAHLGPSALAEAVAALDRTGLGRTLGRAAQNPA